MDVSQKLPTQCLKKAIFSIVFAILVMSVFSSVSYMDPRSYNAYADTTFAQSFDVSGQTATPAGVAFSSDGTKMFVAGILETDIHEYTLGTAFDVSTAGFVDSFDVSGQDDTPTGVAFSSDGTKMFVVGSSGDAVHEYTLGTAFDVSTAGFVDSFDVSGQDDTPTGVAFSSDGKKMYVTGSDSDSVHQYTVEVAFDLFADPPEENDGGGSGCQGDCTPPTLGVDTAGKRLVTDGFSYNGHSVDVELYYTPYPLITVTTGQNNTATFKIYENQGPDNIVHLDFAFGLAEGQIIGDSKAVIEWERTFDGKETVTVIDPQNALDNISVQSGTGPCSKKTDSQCLIITIRHTFREQLDFDMVGTNVWDSSRNAWQNYYNHGIHVTGESLNPPDKYTGIYEGHIYHLTETGKNTAVDQSGDSWTYDRGVWSKDFVKNERPEDDAWKVMNRYHSGFEQLKKGEQAKAAELFDSALFQKTIPESFAYKFGESQSSKLDDPLIQMKMLAEHNVAIAKLDSMFDAYGDPYN